MDPLSWVDRVLAERGARRTGDLVAHQAMPWSSTWRAPTTAGPCWLKRNSIGTRFEPSLLQLLHANGAEGVPDVLATDAARGWSLTADAGAPMRGLPGGEDAARWQTALRLYAAVQRHLESAVPELLAAGVPDHRPPAVPAQAEMLLSDSSAMRRGLPGGFTADAERAVRATLPDLAGWCADLADSPVAVTVQHDDLHATNVLINERGDLTVIDWGDAQVAHPFGTLLTTMRSIAHHTGLDGPGDPRLDPLRDAYLEAWSDVADLSRLRRDAGLAVRIAPVARAHAWRRALRGADAAQLAEYGEAVPGWLTELAAAQP
jgi:hypothetical protein